MAATIKFLGAAGTVTGSKYIVSDQDSYILVDAGLFQGERAWTERNWIDPEQLLGIPPHKITAVLITHAHIDHTGYLPRLVKFGLKCPIYITKPSALLCNILLPDSGRLQEERANYLAKHKKSRFDPPLPLYTEDEAKQVLPLFRTVSFGVTTEISTGITASWHRAGHIIGAASINLNFKSSTITFSGDIGRYTVPLLKDPEAITLGETVLIESTYGDKLHNDSNPATALAQIINDTVARDGVLIIPAFAVGRTQLLLYYIRQLKDARLIKDIPIYVDSPMAIDATDIYRSSPEEYDEEMAQLLQDGRSPFITSRLHYTRNREDSIKLNEQIDPMIIIAGSGMLNGGRVLHHLKHRLSSPLNTVLLVGYQPANSLGDDLKNGKEYVDVLGDDIKVRAKIAEISNLSAHGDQSELMRWLAKCNGMQNVKNICIVHGEDTGRKALAEKITAVCSKECILPSFRQEITLG